MGQLPGNQVGHQCQVVFRAVASGPCLGCLDHGVDPLHTAIGEVGVKAVEYAIPVALDGECKLFHLRYPATQ